VAQLSTDCAQHAAVPPSRRQPKRAQLVWTIACACALAGVVSPAAAQVKLKTALNLKHAEAEHVSKEPFGRIPKGPVQIIISIDQQTLHLYSGGIEIADALVATGVPAHPTPLGIFSIIQKNRFHRSNIYSAAPMPFMERITWSGVALHEGGNLGHRASHGCIRMSHDFATRLWDLTRLGARVIVAHPELRPVDIADPHLFARQATPTTSDPTASAPAAKPLKTAQTSDAGKTADVPHEPEKAAANIAPNGASGDPPASAIAHELRSSDTGTSDAARPGSVAALDPSPATPPKPIAIAHASKAPIAIFVSRKTKTIYVRQDFSPLFDAPVTIVHPDEPLGTHVFTAMDYLDDHASFRWNVVSLPGEPTKATLQSESERKLSKFAKARRREDSGAEARFVPPPPQTPQQALARIDIPQDAIDQISQLIVPGSSLIISDQGLGDETGEGTDFIVVARDNDQPEANAGRTAGRPHHRADAAMPLRRVRALRWEEPFPPEE
jgi:L,D-transpeptidase-like protein